MASVSLAAGPAGRQSSLDVLKCVAAFFVVCIHYGVGTMSPAVRCAVPLFFVITGYYYPMLVERGQFWRHFRKVLAMAVWATLLYAAYAVYSQLRQGALGEWASATFSLRHVAKAMVLGQSLFGFHLWYFHALAYDLLLMHYADKWGLTRHLRWIALLLLLAFCAANFTPWFPHFRNWLFMGLPCMMAGRWIREGKDWAYAFLADSRRCWLYAAAAFALVCAEWVLDFRMFGQWHREMYVFTLPLVLTAFHWALRHPRCGEGGILAWIGRRHSARIYIFHVLVAQLLSHVLPPGLPFRAILFPLAVFASSLLASVAWGIAASMAKGK